MTKQDMRDLAAEWLAPMDELLGDLIEQSETMTPGAFMVRVDEAVQGIPRMFSTLNQKALADALEAEMGEAVIRGIERNV
jgi:type II secretory pathway predicted ATPase ExeA